MYKPENLVVSVIDAIDYETGITLAQVPVNEFSRSEPTFSLMLEQGGYTYQRIPRRIGKFRVCLSGEIGELVGVFDRTEHADKIRSNVSLGTIHVLEPPRDLPVDSRVRIPFPEKVSYHYHWRGLTHGGFTVVF